MNYLGNCMAVEKFLPLPSLPLLFREALALREEICVAAQQEHAQLLHQMSQSIIEHTNIR